MIVRIFAAWLAAPFLLGMTGSGTSTDADGPHLWHFHSAIRILSVKGGAPARLARLREIGGRPFDDDLCTTHAEVEKTIALSMRQYAGQCSAKDLSFANGTISGTMDCGGIGAWPITGTSRVDAVNANIPLGGSYNDPGYDPAVVTSLFTMSVTRGATCR